eukprot:TRINITY_DN3465_c0_g4_i1.p1 TRINITY_DN3465_c0_g4~~TRINITY_DN3465_c0_g4_i1.p1  ORF type:complete len:447 (-),score=58.43 TRINITY_DN3465_c0_g4_i1:163-1503(-)
MNQNSVLLSLFGLNNESRNVSGNSDELLDIDFDTSLNNPLKKEKSFKPICLNDIEANATSTPLEKESSLDWFELISIPWGQAVLRVLKQIVIHLKPADRLALSYLLITFPLCFIAADTASMVWFGIWMRLLIIPSVIFLRSFCGATTSSIGSSYVSNWFTLSIPGRFGKLLHKFSGTSTSKTPSETFTFSFGLIKLLYVLLDGYVVFLWIYLYSETGHLIANIHGDVRYDNVLKGLEQDMFMGQPSKELRNWYPVLNSKVLGEYLHFCYFMYYFIIGSVVVILYFTRPRESFDSGCTAISTAFLSCYLFYIFYPVEGPYWSFSRPEPETVSYFFCYLVRFVLKGSAKGTAFPSGHCAISMVCWIVSMKHHVCMAIVYLFFVPGLIFATVWCGFHYGIDAGAGTIWGVVCGIGGMLLAKHSGYVRPYHDRANYGVGVKARKNPVKFI